MTTWPEEGSSSEDQFEFYDPTASVPADEPSDGGSAERTSDNHGAADLPEGVDEGAISDPTGAVHVWVDADHRLTAVRVSNRWRERLNREKKTLAEVVLAVVKGTQAKGGAPLWEIPSVEHASASPLSGAALDRLMERSMTLDEQAVELRSRPATPTRFRGEGAEGWSENRKVRVKIDTHARTVEVDIDDAWTKQANTEGTGAAILQAHQAAYAQWTAPEVEPGEWDLLHGERAAIRDEIMAMFRHGI